MAAKRISGPWLTLRPLEDELKRAALAGEARSPASNVARTVLARWERSRRLGADPVGRAALEGGVASVADLAHAKDRTEELRRGAAPILEGFAATCARADFVGVLADAAGVVVDTFGGGSFEREARRLRLIEGAEWVESLRGTNAIGTALSEERPVAVHGAAHFAEVNEGLVCFAAPIRDPRGRVVGVLDATSYAERAAGFDPSIVTTVARAVEEVLRAREYAACGGGIALTERLMERTNDAAFLVECPVGRGSQGRVVRVNTAGRALVGSATSRGAVPPWSMLCSMAAASGRGRWCSPVLGEVDLAVEPLSDARGELLAILVLIRPSADAPLPKPAPGTVPEPFSRIHGSDSALADARERATRLARSTLPVLLLAETGTGKELFARAIHDASPRATGPYVALNCGAIQPELLLTELFGHAPGAFTGAAKGGRDGLVAAADGGTLFLDEVADLSADAQVALLRVLEDGSFQRVGEAAERQVDLRIVAATSRDLRERVARGEFRDDLFFRIGGACIELPALRERTDLDGLVDLFWRRLRTPEGDPTPPLAPATRAALRQHTWPGNVRELESALEYASVMGADAAEVQPAHLPPALGSTGAARSERSCSSSLDDARRAAIAAALEAHGGNVSAAARELGVARSTVYRLSRRLGL